MARSPADPPDLAPEVLWRSLLPFRPRRALSFRIRGADHIPLYVCAIPAMQEALARDAGTFVARDNESLRTSIAAREVLAMILHDPSGRAFPSVAGMMRMDEHELGALAGEAFQVFGAICPSYARSNIAAWKQVLEEGARHPENLAEAAALASCIDATMGGPIPRPDRYWGCPVNQLLDGHWMCWNAARDAMKK